ncbi:HAD-IA family hydrolase [Streptomyces sp. NPDC005840]|uniref:HAD-IA family hydrolase n=1 Tax=Streptomyces doudnae TaxID=3075536 RepID=A0ABD5EV81_9ACTN|nr:MULTISPECIES: HAD-IA family hydrolase [unclassified Streptomyces]MDT0438550.1 HAD-IA family hydrolase [Streptomyces sp. DSM 41981]SCD74416.1 haloacid dehalogenase superfamily, subfamily IA, variant 3 with third motif having DD or ED [Streptomyces sp. SolWspMP-5a-2]
MTSDTAQTEPVAEETAYAPEELRNLITRPRVVLWDFDGPVCRLFAGYPARDVAADLIGWLEGRGLRNLLTDDEQETHDPQVVLRAVDRLRPGSDLVTELEERLTRHELDAEPSAWPTPYADPLIRTWTAVGARLAVATNNSATVVRAYLEGRGLLSCFAPHIYGRTQDLHRLKPHPHCLNQALNATGTAPEAALMIGDAPSDCAAAAEAGVPFLGFARNERKAALLRQAGAETVVDSLQPLFTLLRG